MFTIEYLGKLRSSQLMNGFAGVDGFTPLSLVVEQFDKIQLEWSNPNLTIFLPAAGHGTYGIVGYWRLMEGLKDVFINEDERSRHILKNMLYLNEINPWLCRQLSQQGFINIIEGDFLNENIDMKFDVVIGNPPYQENSATGKSKGGGRGGDKNLYSKFIKKSDEIIKENGLIMFLTPPSIFSPQNNNKKILFHPSNNLVLVKILDENPFPNVGTNVCYFLLKKEKKTETKFLTKDGELIIDLNESTILPNTINSTTVSIFNKVFNSNFPKFHFQRDCSLHTQNKNLFSESQNDDFPYPVFAGSKIKYTSKIPNNLNEVKIVVSRSGYYKPILDNGQKGTTETNFYLPTNEPEFIFQILNHNLYRFIMETSKFNGFIHQHILKSLPNPNTFENLFDVFQLTEKEKNYISENVRN